MDKHPFYDLMLDLDRDAHRPVTRVFRHVMLVARFFETVIDETASRFDLHPGEFLVLMTLERRGGSMRPTEIYRSLLVTAGAITKRIDSLAGRGLVERIACESDGRSAQVRLTKSGRKLAAEVRAMPTPMHQVAEQFGAEHLEELDTLLRRYLDVVANLPDRDA